MSGLNRSNYTNHVGEMGVIIMLIAKVDIRYARIDQFSKIFNNNNFDELVDPISFAICLCVISLGFCFVKHAIRIPLIL